MTLPFSLPATPTTSGRPEWTGTGFRVGSQVISILEYSENPAGWSDGLTALHEGAVGDRHPIDVASRADAIRQLRVNLKRNLAPVILEVGCSSGFMLRSIVQAFPHACIIGADVVREPLLRLACELPAVPLLRFDLLQCPLPSASFDAVVALNVLEHIENDIGALEQIYRILKPGGVAIIEVPAGPHLYDAYDKALMHFRRYELKQLTAKLEQVGFVILRRSHLGFFVYPAFVRVKRNNLHAHPTDPATPSGEVVAAQASGAASSWLMKAAMTFERHVGQLSSFPVGIRCLAVGKK